MLLPSSSRRIPILTMSSCRYHQAYPKELEGEHFCDRVSNRLITYHHFLNNLLLHHFHCSSLLYPTPTPKVKMSALESLIGKTLPMRLVGCHGRPDVRRCRLVDCIQYICTASFATVFIVFHFALFSTVAIQQGCYDTRHAPSQDASDITTLQRTNNGSFEGHETPGQSAVAFRSYVTLTQISVGRVKSR